MRFKVNRRYSNLRTKLPKKWKLAGKVMIFLMLMTFAYFFVDIRVRPALFKIAQAKALQMATRAINEAIQSKISMNLRYEDLIAVKVDNRGRVVLIQPNTGEINRLASKATIEVQQELRSIRRDKAYIPLGQVLNSHLLGGAGPLIPVSIIPIGTVTSKVYDTFEQAGINQTRHKVHLEIKATVKMIVPLKTSNVVVRTEVPLTEAIIMGEVPQVYFGGNPNVTFPAVPINPGNN